MSLSGFTLNGLGPDPDDSGATAGERRLVAQICQPTLVLANARGATRVSDTGRIMHLVYEVSGNDVRPGKNTGGQAGGAYIRMNVNGSHILNYRGNLYLADGEPVDTYYLNIKLVPLEWHHLHMHYLTGWRSSAGDYVTPPFHSELRGRDGLGFAFGPYSEILAHEPLFAGLGQQSLTLHDRGGIVVTGWFG